MWYFSARSSYEKSVPPLPDIPFEVFKACGALVPFHLQLILSAIGTAIGELFASLVITASGSRRIVSDISAFCVIIWFAYSTATIFRFSSLVRTIVTDGTVYFIIVTVIQMLLVLSVSISDVRHRPLSIPTHLTNSLSDYCEGETVHTHVRTLLVGRLCNLTNSS